MKKSIKTLILAAAMMAGPFVFTSCEELFGEWDKPTPVTPTPDPTPTPTPEPTPDPIARAKQLWADALNDGAVVNIQFTYNGKAYEASFKRENGAFTLQAALGDDLDATLQDVAGATATDPRNINFVIKNKSTDETLLKVFINTADDNVEAMVADAGISFTGVSVNGETVTINEINVTTPGSMTVSAKGYTGTFDDAAHSITVTAPEGATITYGTTEGTYNLTTNPSYTNAGSYTVYYKVKMEDHITVTGSATVVINKAAASISYATTSIGKQPTDGAFTNALTNTGDGKVTYSTTATNVTVNESSGEVTIKAPGEATIKATVTDGTNYTYATKEASYTLTVSTMAMTVEAAGYKGTYDKAAHGITVSVKSPTTGATVKYGEAKGTYNQSASPTYADAGKYTVYYQVTSEGYTTVTGSATVVISKAAASISYATASIEKQLTDAAFINTLTDTGDGSVKYSSNKESVATVDENTGEVTIKAPGEATIKATVTDGTNYTYATKTASYTVKVLPQGTISDYDKKDQVTW